VAIGFAGRVLMAAAQRGISGYAAYSVSAVWALGSVSSAGQLTHAGGPTAARFTGGPPPSEWLA